MYQKLFIIIGNNYFLVLDTYFVIFNLKKAKKTTFQVPNFGPSDDKNAIETLS